MAVTSVVEELRKDHETLRSHVTAFDGLVQARGRGLQEAQQMPGGALRERLASLGAELAEHFRREEEGLFPEARRLVAEGAPGAEVIAQFFREEAEDDAAAHGVLRTRMYEMLSLLAETGGHLEEEQGHRFRTRFGLFRTVLELHAAKEEGLIFPMIERSLTPSQREAVLEQLRVLPPSVP